MRPFSRQRVAAWLLALQLGRGGEEYTRRGRLEMISFWLLCWKLLRATAGLRRTTPELTDSNHDNDKPVDDSSTHTQQTDPVAMEINSSSPLTDLERHNLFSSHSQEVENLQYEEVHGVEEENTEGKYGNRDGDECDYLVFEIGESKGGKGGVHSGAQQTDKKTAEDKGADRGRGEAEGVDGQKGETEGEEEGRDPNVTIGDGYDEDKTVEEDEGREKKGDEGDRRETKMEEGGRGYTKTEDKWREGIVGEMEENVLPGLVCISDSPLCSSSSQPITSDPSEQPVTAMWQETWVHNLSSRDDLSDGHLSDCLQAELAVVYSDSDTGEDQWAGFANSDITKQEERGGGIQDGTCNGEQRQEEHCEDVVTGTEKLTVEDSRTSDEEAMKTRRDLFLCFPSVGSLGSSTNPDRKLPVDFCVHQETCSENVSTEHLDFLLARQQWKKMEEEVKGQPIPKPGLVVQGSIQGTYTSLYPPSRSPRLKHREINPSESREPPLSFTLSPSSEDSGLDDSLHRNPAEEPESAVEREIRLTLEREEKHRRERGMIAQGLPRPSTLHTGRSPPRPPACRTPTLSISPSPSCSSTLSRSAYHEMTANNVIILEPDSSNRSRLFSSAIGGLSDWPASLDAVSSTNVIVVETSNLIIRSASEFCLSSPPVTVESQESTFSSNPFFKLRSLSSQSLVEQEIRMVRQREAEWRRQREEMWKRRREEEWRRGRETYDTVLVSPSLSDNISFKVPEVPDRCVSSPSSPMRTRKMERSSLSCDHKFPPVLSSVPRRQNTMAQRWEASLLANQKKA